MKRAVRVAQASVLLFCVMSLFSHPAWGHAAFQSGEPAKGSRLDQAPSRVVINYAEPPTTDSTFAVFDGCERDVTEDFEALNNTIEAQVGEGQPGRWRVEWSVVSAVDGHLTKDQMSFQVAGQPDCSSEQPSDDPSDVAAPPDEDEGSSPIIPIVIAAVVIAAIAAGVRIATSR